MKDFGVIDYLMDLIYLPFKNSFYMLEMLTQEDYFTKLLKLSYNTLTISIQEYRPNEMYAS